MARTEGDSWDLASSVGATATMVAVGRAVASTDEHGLINDPWAAPLVRAVGIPAFTMMVDGTLDIADVAPQAAAQVRSNIDEMAVRTKFFDDYFLAAGEQGIRQAVILASGLDSRAYRLPWADGTVVYEVDQPEVIAFKTATLSGIGAEPTATHRTVAVDLREDWPKALRDNGFDSSLPTSWSAEGLLIYLPPEAQDKLFDNITALSAPGSRLATEHVPDLTAFTDERSQHLRDRLKQLGSDLEMADLVYQGERRHPVEYLAERGWDVTAVPNRDAYAANDFEFPDDEMSKMMGDLSYIRAVYVG